MKKSAGSSSLDDCQALLQELDSLEHRLSGLAADLAGAAAHEDSPIEGIIDSHSEVEEEFAALRVRIVTLGRTYGLCPQEVPDEGYSPGRLRGLLESIQRKERGFKQPPPESLESLWGQVPADMLASLENSAQQAAEEAAQGFSPGERLPSDIEIFLDRVISDARHAALEETKLPSGRIPSGVTASILRTPVPKRQVTATKRQNPAPDGSVPAAPAATREVPADAGKTVTPPASASGAEPLPLSVPTMLPSEVLKVAADAEQEACQAAAAQEETQHSAASEQPEAIPGPQGPQTTAPSGDWKPASVASERDYRELLEYGEMRLGLGRSEFADLLANLALLNHKQGCYADAEELHRKELMIRENELGPDHPKVATSLNNLALLCRDMGRNQEAQELWERSLAVVEMAFGPEHPKVALRLANLADLLHACGKTDQAERLYRRLLTLRDTGSGRRRREAKSSLRKYASLLRSTRRKGEARRIEAEITSKPGWLPKWR